MSDGSLVGVEQGIRVIHALIGLEVSRMREQGVAVGEDEYRGLYTSDAEAARLSGQVPDANAGADERAAPLLEQLRELAENDDGRFGFLCRLGGLSEFEAGCLLLCVASEADLGIERLIGYVQDDVTKRRPRVDLAVRLLAAPNTGFDALSAFDASAPLRKLLLLSLHEEPGQAHTPLRAQYLALDRRISSFLLGGDGIDERIEHFARLETGVAAEHAASEQIAPLASLPAARLEPPVVELRGPDEAERLVAARHLAEGSGLGLLRVRLGSLASDEGLEPALTRSLREAALQEAALLADEIDRLSAEDGAALRTRLREGTLARLVILGSTGSTGWPGVALEIPGLSFQAQHARWRAEMGAEAEQLSPELEAIAGKFRLSSEGIRDAVRTARGLAIARDPAAPAVRSEDLHRGARTQSAPILSDLAKKITPHYTWDDIILPRDAQEQLREMCAHVEYSHVVYETWGLGRKLASGKGVIALFAGQSGTGKTMAADVMAGALQLDLYKIDLSGVVSKYIGETEKNLASIFGEASRSNAILFFDEADALFGKRSEVKDAHDRYANIETAYLLQRMEEYSGIVILATNLKANLDEAFLRRMHFLIDFPMPEEDERRRIWKATVPQDMPLGGDVDFDFLARQFKVAGGNIRNVVLAAAFLAASDGRAAGMEHFVRGMRREYQKLGRMVTAADFGEYVSFARMNGNGVSN